MTNVLAQAWPIIRNDQRLLWREMNRDTASVLRTWFPLVFLFGTIQVVAALGIHLMRQPPPPGYETLVWAYLTALMLPMAMTRAIILLYERSDLDLLLSSPLPAAAVLLGRLGSIALSCFAVTSLFLLPVLNALVVHFGPRYFAAFAVWALLALLNAAAGIGLTLVFVQRLGPRRTRVVAQIFAAALGAFPALVCLLPVLLDKHPNLVKQRLQALIDHPAFTALGRAGHGAPLELAFLFLLTAGLTILVARQLAQVFVLGAQESTVRPVPARIPAAHRWREGLWPVMIRKELRLLGRSPIVYSQILPTLVPLLIFAGIFVKIMGPVVLAPMSLYLSGTLALVLGTCSAQGEMGWDLVRLSATSARRVRTLKVAVCVALVLVPVMVAAVILALTGRPGLALLTPCAALPGAIASGWVVIATIQPSARQDVFKPPTGRALAYQLITMTLAMIGAGGLALIGSGSLGFGWFALGILGLGSLACVTVIDPDPVASS